MTDVTNFIPASTNGAGELICERCGKSFATAQGLGQHRRIGHHPGVTCPECGKRFKAPTGMASHRRAAHGVPAAKSRPPKPRAAGTYDRNEPVVCLLCEGRTQRRNIYRHTKTRHPGRTVAYLPVAEYETAQRERAEQERQTALPVVVERKRSKVRIEHIHVDDVVVPVVGALYPGGTMPVEALPDLFAWREATNAFIEKITEP